MPGPQHLNVKLFVAPAATIDLEQTINVFHSWIQERRLDDLLIDVADYRHVPSGPGVILIGHNAQYSLDLADGEPGVLYNRKTVVEAPLAEQTEQAIRTNLTVCRLLAGKDALGDNFQLATDRLQFIVNDRLLAPNDPATFERLKPAFTEGLVRAFGEQAYEFTRSSDPRKRLTVTVVLPSGFTP